MVQVARATAAMVLLLIGCSALIGPRRSLSFDQVRPSAEAASTNGLMRELMQREISMDQRREVEDLLGSFTRAQMTRHYWGEFAGSLSDLGLTAAEHLNTTMDRNSVRTRLWIVPVSETEAYLAEVERWNGRLRTRQCRGHKQSVGLDFEGDCPPGWTSMTTRRG